MEPRHPTQERALSPLERGLWRFRISAHEAQVIQRGLNQYPDAADAINGDLWFAIANQSLLVVSKFLEVWHEFGALAKSEARVITARRIAQPFVTRILIWPGLTDLRNTFSAHAYTARDGTLVPPWALLEKEMAPTYHAEVMLLLNLVPLAVAAILSVFEVEFLGIQELTRPPDESIPAQGPGIALGTEIQPTLRDACREADGLHSEQFGRPVWPALIRAFRLATIPREP